MSSKPVHANVYSIQHYVIKFVSDLGQVCVFFPGTVISSNIKTDHHDITENIVESGVKHYNQTKPILFTEKVLYLAVKIISNLIKKNTFFL